MHEFKEYIYRSKFSMQLNMLFLKDTDRKFYDSTLIKYNNELELNLLQEEYFKARSYFI